MKKLIPTLFVFLLAAPLAAQQAKTGLGGFSFVAPFQVAVGTDNNFIVDRTKPAERLFVLSLPPSVQPLAPDIRPLVLSDQVMLLTLPRVAYQHESRRHLLTATYVPEIELFGTYHDLNAVNHTAEAEFTYFLNRRVSISAGEAYRSTHDPARTLQNVFLLLPLGQYRENGIHGGVEYEASPLTAYMVEYNQTRTTFGQPDPLQARNLNDAANSASFTVNRMLKRNHRLSASYAYIRIKPINQTTLNDDRVDLADTIEPVHSVRAQYRINFSSSSTVEFSGGFTSLGTSTNYTFQVDGNRRFGDIWVGAGYGRELAYTGGFPTSFANGLTPAGLYDIVMFRMKGQPRRRVGIQMEATASRDASGRLARSARSMFGRARLDYRWTDRMVTFATAETYQQNFNDFVRTPLSRNRFLVGFEFSLSGERERRTNGLNQDEQYVALTDHVRRRPTPQ